MGYKLLLRFFMTVLLKEHGIIITFYGTFVNINRSTTNICSGAVTLIFSHQSYILAH